MKHAKEGSGHARENRFYHPNHTISHKSPALPRNPRRPTNAPAQPELLSHIQNIRALLAGKTRFYPKKAQTRAKIHASPQSPRFASNPSLAHKHSFCETGLSPKILRSTTKHSKIHISFMRLHLLLRTSCSSACLRSLLSFRLLLGVPILPSTLRADLRVLLPKGHCTTYTPEDACKQIQNLALKQR